MEFCCPSPENPAFIPNAEALKHRRYLRYVIYGEVFVVFAKMFLMSIISGIF